MVKKIFDYQPETLAYIHIFINIFTLIILSIRLPYRDPEDKSYNNENIINLNFCNKDYYKKRKITKLDIHSILFTFIEIITLFGGLFLNDSIYFVVIFSISLLISIIITIHYMYKQLKQPIDNDSDIKKVEIYI